MQRYSRNVKTLSAEENDSLKNFKVCVIGCGGLGGYIVEELGRLGIGFITAVDGDVFDESNLNRQLLSAMDNLGCSKASAAEGRMKRVNPLVTVMPIQQRLDKDNGMGIINGHDVIIDALDNIESRLVLEELAGKAGIPLVHGAIAGWYGQVTTVFPGDGTLSRLYPYEANYGIERELGNPSFTPAMVASIQVAEAVKILIKRGDILRKKILVINLLNQEFEVIEL
ncbi:MAG: molybdopterin biosynthesis protein MoeB [Clostridia bacterium BRH_c25]|nr:MAG: molybdopterin biosynthesis protein MoeB [Clostridia bacterium BRH_c25]